MVEHLTQKQFEGYRSRQLEVEELLSVCDHLDVCEACRRRVETAADGDAAFYALRSGVFGEAAEVSAPHAERAHLTAEQTAAYVDGALAGESLETVTDHLSNCEHCALSVEDLRAFKDQITPSLAREYQPAAVAPPTESRWRRAFSSLASPLPLSPRPAFGAALAVLLLAVAGWVVWRATHERAPEQEVVVSPSPAQVPAPVVSPSPESQPTPPQPETAPAVAQINDGGGSLTLDREGRLSGADALPPAYRELLKETLAGRRIERSPQLRGLTRPGSSLMSSDTRAGEFSVLDPVGSVLLTDRPTFRWSPMEGASVYVVEVYDDGFNLVASSPQLNGRSWAASQTLPRGKVYSWQVKAVKDGEEVKAPRPPAPQARFRVLDRPKADELARAKRAYPSSHLTLALLYADAGLLNEAERELRLLQKANPGSDIARSLLRQVQALRRRSE
ncbi:MAG: zf-HC2 domain-containing protein [Pyrinomonadaceae bacterium]